MSVTIHKYRIEPGRTKLSIPEGARVLSAGVQGEEVFIWVQLRMESEPGARYFRAFATGEELAGGERQFIDTVFMGPLVFHVFELWPTAEELP